MLSSIEERIGNSYNAGQTGRWSAPPTLTTQPKEPVAMADGTIPLTRSAAKAVGSTHYASERPCPKGHVGLRYTSTGSCVSCLKAHTKNQTESGYYSKNYIDRRAEKLAKMAANYERRRDSVIRRAKKWSAANPEKRRIISKSYKARRRAQESGGISTAELGAWSASQKKVCYWCGSLCGRGFHIDHYHPLSRGGKHEADNLVISCGPCNRAKSARDPYEFARRVGRLF